MTIYRPAVAVQLDVPVLGRTNQRITQANQAGGIPVQLAVRSVRLERNDHNHADAVSISALWQSTPLDPRTIDDAVVSVWLGEENDKGVYQPKKSDSVFIGVVSTIRVNRDSDEPTFLEIEALDYTALFLQAKPFGSDGVPEYALNLEEAWRKICSQTPGAGFLASSLELRGLDAPPKLSSAVHPRFASVGKVQTHPETDAWAVWQQCVGMLGLISFIESDRCVVTTATNYYTSKDPPRLVWGRDIVSFSEERDIRMTDRGVACTSFDSISGQVVEVFFEPPSRSAQKLRGGNARSATTKTPLVDRERFDFFAVPGVSQRDVLERIAESIYEQRARQELSGRLKTAHMRTTRVSGSSFNLLQLGAGDDIRVDIDSAQGEYLLSLPSHSDRVAYLVRQGHAPALADLLAYNAEQLADIDSTFFVSSVVTEFESDNDSITFSIEIDYVNRIKLPEKT